MSGVRFFSGSRDQTGKKSPASELMRFEIMKKGKLPPGERYKHILKQKLAENKQKAMGDKFRDGPKMSKRAEEAIKQISAKKAAKEAKRMRQMVIIQPKNYYNGSLDRKGKVYDVAGNVVGKVNGKNGKITFGMGMLSGKYKPRSIMTDIFLQDGINKYSPYFINMRKMQAMQQGWNPQTGTYGNPDTLTLHGPLDMGGGGVHGRPQMAGNVFGTQNDGAARTNVSGSAWGVVSDNVWGNFADNAWGTMVDNVWGGAESNVWGGIGGNSLWSWKGAKVWGTGNGKNYLRGVTGILRALFGGKMSRSERGNMLSRLGRNSTGRSSSGSSGRSGGSVPRGRSR